MKLYVWFKKIISLILVVTFFLTSHLSYAGDIVASNQTKAKSSFGLSNQIDFPSELGEIKSRTRGTQTTVIHIQNAHGELDAQRKIAKLLEHLGKQYQFKDIFIEGLSEGAIDRSVLQFFKEPALNQKLLENLLQKKVINGAELYFADAPPNVRVFGTEVTPLYLKNLSQFRSVYQFKESTDLFLEKLETHLSKKTSHIFKAESFQFLKEWFLFQTSRKDLSLHLSSLSKHAKQHLNLDLHNSFAQTQYPALMRFIKLKDLESMEKNKTQDKEKTKEITQFTAWLETVEPDSQYLETFRNIFNHASIEIDIRSFLESFYTIVEPKGFSFKNYPSLSMFLGRRILAQELEGIALYEEVRMLADRIMAVIAKTNQEKKATRLWKDFVILRKLFSLELSRVEWNQVRQKAHQLKPSEFEMRVASLSKQELLKEQNTLRSENAVFKKAFHFYASAQKRESAIFQNMINVMRKKKIETAILVTGGFHEQGISRLIDQSGFSRVTVNPKISELEDSGAYVDRMMLRASRFAFESTIEFPTLLNVTDAHGQMLNGRDADYIREAVRVAMAEMSQKRSELRKSELIDSIHEVNVTRLPPASVKSASIFLIAGLGIMALGILPTLLGAVSIFPIHLFASGLALFMASISTWPFLNMVRYKVSPSLLDDGKLNYDFDPQKLVEQILEKEKTVKESNRDSYDIKKIVIIVSNGNDKKRINQYLEYHRPTENIVVRVNPFINTGLFTQLTRELGVFLLVLSTLFLNLMLYEVPPIGFNNLPLKFNDIPFVYWLADLLHSVGVPIGDGQLTTHFVSTIPNYWKASISSLVFQALNPYTAVWTFLISWTVFRPMLLGYSRFKDLGAPVNQNLKMSAFWTAFKFGSLGILAFYAPALALGWAIILLRPQIRKIAAGEIMFFQRLNSNRFQRAVLFTFLFIWILSVNNAVFRFSNRQVGLFLRNTVANISWIKPWVNDRVRWDLYDLINNNEDRKSYQNNDDQSLPTPTSIPQTNDPNLPVTDSSTESEERSELRNLKITELRNRAELRFRVAVAKDVAFSTVRGGDSQVLASLKLTDRLNSVGTGSTGFSVPFVNQLGRLVNQRFDHFSDSEISDSTGSVILSADDPIFIGENGEVLFRDISDMLVSVNHENKNIPWVTIAGKEANRLRNAAIQGREAFGREVGKVVKFNLSQFDFIAGRDGSKQRSAILSPDSESANQLTHLLFFINDSSGFDQLDRRSRALALFTLLIALSQASAFVKSSKLNADELNSYLNQSIPGFEARSRTISLTTFWQGLLLSPRVKQLIAASA